MKQISIRWSASAVFCIIQSPPVKWQVTRTLITNYDVRVLAMLALTTIWF